MHSNKTPDNKDNAIENDNQQRLKNKLQQNIVDVNDLKATKDRNGKPHYQNVESAKTVSKQQEKDAAKGKKDALLATQQLNSQQIDAQQKLNDQQINQKRQNQLKRDNRKKNQRKEEDKDLTFNAIVDYQDMKEANEINSENKEKKQHELVQDAIVAATAIAAYERRKQLINEEIKEELDDALEEQKRLDKDFDLNLANKEKDEKGNKVGNIAVSDQDIEQDEELDNIKEENAIHKTDQQDDNDNSYQALVNPAPVPSSKPVKEAVELFDQIQDDLQKASDKNPEYSADFATINGVVADYQQRFVSEDDQAKRNELFSQMTQDVATIVADPNTPPVVSKAADGSMKAAMNIYGAGLSLGVETKGDENATSKLGTASTFFASPDVNKDIDQNRTQTNEQNVTKSIVDPFKIKPPKPNPLDIDLDN